MDVEVVGEDAATETGTEAPAEPEVGSVIYEQDLRAGSHRNGRAPDMVGPEVKSWSEGGDLPPDLPEEPDRPRRPEGGRPGLAPYLVASTYLVFGALGLYVGITMLRDLRSGKKEKRQ
jgi:hypothetical protein